MRAARRDVLGSALTPGVASLAISDSGNSTNDSTDPFSSSEGSNTNTVLRGSANRVLVGNMQTLSNRNINLESLTINKLRFDSIGLYGREKEIQILKECLERIKIQSSNNNEKALEPRRELVMIKGYSGTGKTALASTLRKPLQKLGGLYVDGKFDIFLRDQPYSGVLSACNQICGTILSWGQNDSSKFERTRQELSSQLQPELGVLLTFLPALEEILPVDVATAAKEEEATKGQTSEEMKNQFNFAFRRFIRVIGSFFVPFVIVLDDLQWADVASLEILDLLMTDRENSNLMIVGVYRSNEVGSTHLLAKTLRELQIKKDEDMFHITEIEVGNLELDSINRMIQDLLCFQEDRVLELADVCHKKTRGNVFFLIRYLRALKERMLLQFNIGLLKWSWNIHEIEQQSDATENVVDLLTSQMRILQVDVRQILQLCAFLGSTFSVRTAALIWNEVFSDSDSCNLQLELGLKTAQEEGFLENFDQSGGEKDGDHSSTYRWIHDKVQEAAMSLVSEDERSAFGGKVGRALVSNLEAKELDEAIFTAVNLLNEDRRVQSEAESTNLATFNLRAAKKATQLSSFSSASKYACKGIEMLPKSSSPWRSHYHLTLELYIVAAEAKVSLGAAEEGESLSRQVIDRTEVPIQDKFRATATLMDSVANRDRMLEGLEMGLAFLSQCGCHFPKTSAGILFQTLKGLAKVKLNAGKFCSKDTLQTLPKIDDPFRIAMMGILHKILPYAYMSRQEYLPLAVMRNLFWTMEYGICEYSASAFAWMGTILSSTGDTSTAKCFAESANRIIETHESGITKSLVLCVTYCFTLHWLNPLQQMLKPLLKSYEVGMQTGDTESAGWGIYHHTFIAFQAGKQLDSLAHDAGIYSRQMWELKRLKQHTYFNVTRQLCLNLMGRAEDHLVLTGEAMDEDDYSERAAADSIHLHPFLICHRMILYGFCGAFAKGAELALKYGDLSKEIPASAQVVVCACINALSLSHMARTTGKFKYKRGAKKLRNKIKTWMASGNPNLKQWDSLLHAELLALQGMQHLAKRSFETSIIVAARSGFLQDAGLASERYGEYLIHELQDQDDGIYRLQEAIRYFGEWGAKGKVHLIEKKYSNLWPKPAQVIVSRSLLD